MTNDTRPTVPPLRGHWCLRRDGKAFRQEERERPDGFSGEDNHFRLPCGSSYFGNADCIGIIGPICEGCTCTDGQCTQEALRVAERLERGGRMGAYGNTVLKNLPGQFRGEAAALLRAADAEIDRLRSREDAAEQLAKVACGAAASCRRLGLIDTASALRAALSAWDASGGAHDDRNGEDEGMSAPTKIWVLKSQTWGWDAFTGSNSANNVLPTVEYVRADIADAALARAEQAEAERDAAVAEVERLREALQWVRAWAISFRSSDRDYTVWTTDQWRELRRVVDPFTQEPSE